MAPLGRELRFPPQTPDRASFHNCPSDALATKGRPTCPKKQPTEPAMSGLPPDPFGDESRPYSAMLDRARQLRLALLDMPNVASVFAAVAALDEDEVRLVLIELALDAWWQRRGSGTA
jgi:hypothetical protein